jgi:Dolichyl-phosphate-mannose-protein mannosyltransferase
VKNPRSIPPVLVFSLFAVLFSALVVPRMDWDSLTNDEPSDIANGYFYWTRGDVLSPHNHPPLGSALQALPLLALKIHVEPFQGDVITRGHLFVFQWNLGRLQALTLACRMVSWLLGLRVGFLLFKSGDLSPPECLFALFFWALDPTFSSLSELAKTDIAPSFFFLAALWAFERSLKKPGPKSSILAGLALGLAVNSKFYCLVLLPVFAVLEALHYREKKEGGMILRRWAWGLGAFLALTLAVYLPGTLCLPGHRQPFYYPVEKFQEDLAFAKNPFPVFFLGDCGLQNHWYYLPVAFLLKEPLPFILLLGMTPILAWSGKVTLKPVVWIPAVLFFAALLPSQNLGVRYLLPIFPLLFMTAGKSLAWLWNRSGSTPQGRIFKGAAVLLLVWQAGSVLASYPHLLGYFNELVPPDKKIHYLGDSNLDWGQDQKRLAETGRLRGWKDVHLAYFGGIDPADYGLPWSPWTQDDLKGPQPGTVYAVNASFLQLGPAAYPFTLPIATGWITRVPPTGKVGDSWYYFEIPGKRRLRKEDRQLVSVPFLQLRGFTPYPPGRDFLQEYRKALEKPK